jgi:tetratricopeptide (TPR) repeat protein
LATIYSDERAYRIIGRTAMNARPLILSTWLLLGLAQAVYAQPQANDYASYEHLIVDGRAWLSQKRFDEARNCFERYAQRFGNDPLVYFMLGTLADESGDFAKAVPLYAKSLAIAKSRVLDSEELRINLGNSLLKLNYFDEAIFDYKRAIEINDKSQLAHLNLSKALLLKGKYAEALSELNRCTELGLEDPNLPLLRALALKNSGSAQEGKKEAMRFLERYDGKNPELKKIVLDLF